MFVECFSSVVEVFVGGGVDDDDGEPFGCSWVDHAVAVVGVTDWVDVLVFVHDDSVKSSPRLKAGAPLALLGGLSFLCVGLTSVLIP